MHSCTIKNLLNNKLTFWSNFELRISHLNLFAFSNSPEWNVLLHRFCCADEGFHFPMIFKIFSDSCVVFTPEDFEENQDSQLNYFMKFSNVGITCFIKKSRKSRPLSSRDISQPFLNKNESSYEMLNSYSAIPYRDLLLFSSQQWPTSWDDQNRDFIFKSNYDPNKPNNGTRSFANEKKGVNENARKFVHFLNSSSPEKVSKFQSILFIALPFRFDIKSSHLKGNLKSCIVKNVETLCRSKKGKKLEIIIGSVQCNGRDSFVCKTCEISRGLASIVAWATYQSAIKVMHEKNGNCGGLKSIIIVWDLRSGNISLTKAGVGIWVISSLFWDIEKLVRVFNEEIMEIHWIWKIQEKRFKELCLIVYMDFCQDHFRGWKRNRTTDFPFDRLSQSAPKARPVLSFRSLPRCEVELECIEGKPNIPHRQICVRPS